MPPSRSRASKVRRPRTSSSGPLAEFFRELGWTRAAPARLRRAGAEGDSSALARALAEHLADRTGPQSLGALAEGVNPYLWSLAKPGQVAGSLQHLLGTEGRRRILDDLDGASRNGRAGRPWQEDARGDSLPTVLAMLCCADLLACQPRAWSSEKLLSTLRHLLVAAIHGAEPKGDVAHAELANLVLRQGELPWSMAVLWPEMRAARELLPPARRALEAGLTRLCGRDGMPHPEHLGVLPLVMASLCRSLWLAREAGLVLWRAPLARRWGKLVLNTLRLLPSNRRLPLAGSSEAASPSSVSVAPELDDELIEAMLALGDDRASCAAWAAMRGPRRTGGAAALRAAAPSVQSDDTRLSVLRTQWQRGGSMLAVRHDRSPVEMELSLRGERVLSGPWEFQLQADGKRLETPTECLAVCWMADDDVVYLELRMKWAEGVCLERQMLLGRREPFALLADAVKTRRKCSLSYVGSMRVAAGLGGGTNRRSRIGWLQRPGQRRNWLLPIGLEQWRVARSSGALELEGDRVRLRATCSGRGLYAPLLVHAYPSRAESVDWRALTVTQARRALGPDQAVAYRIRFSPQRQLLLYRTLGPRGTRAVLGYQTKSEFVFGWFDRDGDVEPLLEVT